MGLSKPIVAFPKKAIEDVCKIKIHKAAFLKKKHINESETALFSNMFEVYLREDYEDVYIYRDEEIKCLE
jgi:hypothetical protein